MADAALTDALLYLLTGGFAGFAAGLLGVGGGLIIVPVLYFIFETQNVPSQYLMHTALATSLATIIVTSISSTLAHHKKQAVLWTVVFRLAPGIAPGAWLGGMLASALDTSVLRPLFAVFELLVAIHLLRKAAPAMHQRTLKTLTAIPGGLVIGLVSAIVGIGGGTLTVPFLHWHNIRMRHAVATSAACGLPIAVFGAASYMASGWALNDLPFPALGYINLPAFGFIAIASYLSAPLGAKLAHWMPEARLKTGFGVFLLALSAKLLLS